ncbi:MAG TPA: cytochrome c [Aliidongia sp.]|uniref:c-type cytochrome n=1 Tax=Aliidongia sp. TaxID=1914230 RepID=UPI002DDCEDC7|nr:cytochrome c [Aliidongia sp.]HEV2677452.1 cytochrome c [Aliidongia sp.]
MGKGLQSAAMAFLILTIPSAVLLTAARAADEPKPYKIENGHVDQATYNGYRRYGESCMRCHGPDGAGSSYAPDLTDSLKHLDHDQFAEVVINGRQNVTTSNSNVMPSFGTAEDVVNYLDDIYGYLKARSDGVLGRGRPKRAGDD